MQRTAVLLATVITLALGWLVAPALALDAGTRLPEIGLTDMRGNRVDAAALKGKVVIVDFWASWCAPCKEEMPVLERLYKKYKGRGLVIVGVSVDEELENVKKFLKQLPVSFSIVHDADHKVANRFKPPRMPSSYVVDRNGIVRHVHAGFREEDAAKLESEVGALLGQ
jgi:thiol-disulfide isomerase/thioredoxin